MLANRLEIQGPPRDASDTRQNLVSRLRPHEGFAVGVVRIDEGADGGFQHANATRGRSSTASQGTHAAPTPRGVHKWTDAAATTDP